MKMAKSLMLASAAGFVAVTGTSAADLGVKKPSAVEYVKTCPQYGAGFFVVPGTTSCLKIIGRVRIDYVSGNVGTTQTTSGARSNDLNVFRARGYIGYDHRTATEYGMLRTYTRIMFTRDNAGAYGTTLEYAFIQFGGLTVGRTAPWFEHGFSHAFYGGTGWADNVYANSIAYTFDVGGGLSATLAAEAPAERRSFIGATAINTANPNTAVPAANAAGAGYGGQAMPELLAKLNYKGSWGEVHAVGALHQLRAAASTVSTVYGFAASLGAKINVSMLGNGSHIWASGTYTDGANNYMNVSNYNAGNLTVYNPDAIIAGGSLRKTKGWGIAGGFQAFVIPTAWVGMQANYSELDPFGPSNKVRTTVLTATAAWVPVSGFLIGAEVGYKAIAVGTGFAAVPAGTDKDGYFGRVRFQRDF